ncbi:MAG: glutathione ABC transporter ATP-binding protein [Betaproteobacteria bacterium RIFCSPLOWO2_12_FULL_62_13]|nr:MAG: glutathione ABC transporter ATP-binding protein [Betaproteobacteria bacterium RIFCSPLOWO2_12_FULL_62_13]
MDQSIVARGQAGVAAPQSPWLLEVDDLHVHFVTTRGVVRAVEGISYKIRPGEVVALVGESGCGKSVSALAIMRLLARPAGRIVAGRILFQGRNLLDLTEDEMREIRGRDIAMIFQEPMTSLNPVLTIGFQIMEPLLIHMGMTEKAARGRAVELLKMVGLPDPERRLGQYPHQFSGGMRQRVMIAIALSCNPKLIIADEPTTALDVTIQAQILQLMKDLSREFGIALVIITHNLGIVARYADRVNVMYAARLAEQGAAAVVFARPLHPYTAGLLRSVPRLDKPRGRKLETIEGLPPNLLDPPPGCRFAPRCPARQDACVRALPELEQVAPHRYSACIRAREMAQVGPTGLGLQSAAIDTPVPKTLDRSKPLLAVRGLKTYFEVATGLKALSAHQAVVRAVDDLSFDVFRGETVGLVGESGCGKTTVGRTLLKLERATAGEIQFGDLDVIRAEGDALKRYRRKIQVIFQDPYSSLNPRMTVGEIIAEPILVHKLAPGRKAAREKAVELLTQVGLFEYMADRYPHELSGGQRQRVGIARALGMQPSFIVCDEPVSALDVSIQAQIINLLEELQQKFELTYLFIAHDLAVVRHISDRVIVMYLGKVMEIADRDALYADPLHPYTRALLDAVPIPDPALEAKRAHRVLGGEVPSPLDPPRGCVFHTRCPLASEECKMAIPELREVRPRHYAACIKL